MATSEANGAAVRPDPGMWVDQHGDALFRYAVARVRETVVAEDLVQETLLAAVRSAEAFQHGSTERTWLIGILRHKVLDHFRQTARDRKLWAERVDTGNEQSDFDALGAWSVAVGEWDSPEKSLERADFWRVFDTCVSDMPESLRTAFVLRERDGLETGVLANLLSTTKANLWVVLSRARQRLRHCLEHRWFAE